MSTPDTRLPPDRDNLPAHRFRQRRMAAALLNGDAESGSPALARLGTGAVAGVFVTIAVVAVVGVLAILRPGGGTAWQEPGAFIIAGETGARYIYRDGELSPVVNYTSARLLLGNDLHVVSVSERSLESAPRGPAIGIAMAPDALPDAAGVVGTDWSVCATGNAAAGPLRTSIRPGQYATGEPVGADAGYLLRTSEQGRTFLLVAGHAHEISGRDLLALGDRPIDAVLVDDDFVAALPAGQPITAPDIIGVGQAGPVLSGTSEPSVIGTLFADRSNAYYVMTQDGLAALTPVQAGLLLVDPRLAPAYGGGSVSPLPITAAQLTGSAIGTVPTTGPGAPPPAQLPAPADWPAGEQQMCLRFADQRSTDLVLGPADPAAAGDSPVRLPTGGGALAATTTAGNATTIHLITDNGVRYPIADQQTLERLGLAGIGIALLPAAVLDLLPQGPTLDVAAAAQPVT
jgi:type VII secretion protein EccB